MIRVFLIAMIAGLAVMLAFAPPAAWSDTIRPRMSLESGAGAYFAVVVIENRIGVYNRDETLTTAHGPVTLHYHTLGGHNATDADQVQVVSLPDGVMADPMRMDLPDGDTGRVCLMEWLGG